MALPLLDVGQLLYSIGPRTFAFRLAALGLSVLQLGLRGCTGFLLICPDPGLCPALGLFDRILALSSGFVRLLFRLGGALLGGLLDEHKCSQVGDAQFRTI